ncbi:histone H2A variant 1 [Tanacetum coccineum]
MLYSPSCYFLLHLTLLIKQIAGKGGKGFLARKTLAGGGNKDKVNKGPTSRSSRAGLQFPVGRIHRHLKTRTSTHRRVGATDGCADEITSKCLKGVARGLKRE